MKPNRDDISPDVLALCKKWEVQVTLTFAVVPEDIEYRYQGDAEVDFARRAVERLQPALNRLLDTSDFNGYFIRPVMPDVDHGHVAKRVL